MKNISYIRQMVRKYLVRQTFIDVLTHTCVLVGTLLITVSAAFWLLRSPWYGLIGLVPIFFFRRTPFIKRVKILEAQMGLNGELVNSLQLSHIPHDSREGYSQELIQAYIRDTAAHMESIDVTQYVHHAHLWRSLRFVLVSLVVALIQPALLPERFWYALTHHIEYTVSPGNVPFLEDAPVELSLTLSGVYLPNKARLVTITGTDKTSEILDVTTGTCRTQIRVHEPFSYYFEFFTHVTGENNISKIEPISIEELTFHLSYPPYVGMQDETKTGRRIIAPMHTRVHIKGRASHPLNSASFIYSDTFALDCDATDFSGAFTIQQTATATLALSSFTDLHEPITIYAIPDLPPLVDIFSPGNDIIIPHGMEVPVGIRCSDDYGLVSGRFVAVSGDTQETNLSIKRYALEDTLYFNWDLSGLNLFPGDEVIYFVEIRDNAGNVATSTVYTVYFPTMEEIYQDISSQENMIESGLEQLQEIHADEQDALSRIEEKILRERTFEWTDQENVRELIRNEQDILDKIDEWQDELTRTIDKLNEGIVLDQSSLQRLEEISKILQEIAPDELRHALEELQTALGKKPQDLQKAIENLKEHQEDLAMALERTLELLKRFQQEERLRELTERAQELAAQAHELAETGTPGSSDEELSELRKEIQRLADLLEEMAAAEGLEHDIQKALEQLAENASNLAAQVSSLGQTQASLDQLAAELSRLYESLVKGRSARLHQDLLAIFNQLLAISQAEERLIEESAIDTAWQDNVIRATKQAAESLFTLQNTSAYVTPGMGKNLARALAHMRKAKTGLQQNDNEREAMKLINIVCYELLKNMETAAQASSSSGMANFLQQLSQISQGQMQLNQSLGLLFPVPAIGLSPSQQAQLSRLAARQRALRESLESLRNEVSGSQQQDLLNNLIDEMKETEEALYQHKLDRELFERQQKILTRLLDTQKSIRKADYQKERKSKPGAAFVVQEQPRPLGEDLGRDRLREIIRRAMQDDYPKEYELYIREYFERLLEEQ